MTPSAEVYLSIVILSFNTRELTRACLRSLQSDRSDRSREIIVVDNASEDGSPDMVASEFPSVILLSNRRNLLYAEGNNVGVRQARGEWICLLNSDTEESPGALDQLVGFLVANPGYAAAGPRLLNPDGSVQRACARFPTLLDPLAETRSLGWLPFVRQSRNRLHMTDFDHIHSVDVDQPPGACLVMRRSEYVELGGFDSALSLFFNDVDLCQRIHERGRRIRYVASAEVMHHQGESVAGFSESRVLWKRNYLTYFHKRYGSLGALYLRLLFRLVLFEMSIGVRLGSRERAEKREALEEVRRFKSAVFSPPVE